MDKTILLQRLPEPVDERDPIPEDERAYQARPALDLHERSALARNPENRVLGCDIPGCEGEHVGRGLCHPHYRKWERYGDPLFVAPPRGLSDDQKAEIIRLSGEGLSHGKIAATLDLTRGVVSGVLRRHNEQQQKRGTDSE